MMTANLLFNFGFFNKITLLQDIAMGCFSTMQGSGFVICFAMVCRGLSTSKGNNAAAVLGIFTMCGSTAVIVVNGIGGWLFGLHEIYPYLFLELPAIIILACIMIVNVLCC
jgi:hypothetical protein